MRRVVLATLMAIGAGAWLTAQTGQSGSGANPLVWGARRDFRDVTANLTAAAEQIPERLYDYRPIPEVRSFAQLFAHLADEHYLICTAALGESRPAPAYEKTRATPSIRKAKSSKAEILQVFKDSVAYCDRVFASMTDADATQLVPFFGQPIQKLTAMSLNSAHDHEHYGNIVTYMRLNRMVPPSSQPRR